MSQDFNPNSLDAKISQILTNQENEAAERKRMFDVIEDHGKRISGLERWRAKMAVIVGIAFVGFEMGRDWLKQKLLG